LFIIVIGMLVLPKKAFAFDVPAPQGAVTDLTNTLSFNEEAEIESLISKYRAQSTNEIGVLIIESLEGETVESVALQTFNTWGIGKRDINNGALLLIAKKEHRTRIETGNGLRDRLTDKACARILEMVAVHLRDGRFADGIEGAVLAMEAELSRNTSSDLAATSSNAPVTPVTPPPSNAAEPRSSWPSLMLILFGGLFVFVLCRLWLGRDARWHGYNDSSSYTDHSSWTSSGWDSGGGGGGGGGGDSGGFGGGSSDGGGSSGSY